MNVEKLIEHLAPIGPIIIKQMGDGNIHVNVGSGIESVGGVGKGLVSALQDVSRRVRREHFEAATSHNAMVSGIDQYVNEGEDDE
ncbi:hypothetical protein HNP86_001960 [Methanococcus maripaludis]|uniref:Uncharacterized protein n=1 Tax=Methanococcus maripaludis TaxID=39152 RepID=A0A7J9NWX6_METMI|nr:hypothetical protein [Methanococcus maripaludis]MBA2851801.1 hypothetical protein [Methanococcus maripaludis]